MKRGAAFALLLAAGFTLKVTLVEVERYVHVKLVDACFAQYQEPITQEQEAACYAAPNEHAGYRVLAALSFQPEFWKNIGERCTDGKDAEDNYFGCGWWNRLDIGR